MQNKDDGQDGQDIKRENFKVLAIPEDSADATMRALAGLGELFIADKDKGGGGGGGGGGGTLSGTSCSLSGPKLSPSDFNCTDSDG